jgi:3-deoxy-D-manno-octulosonic-acid transferase
MHAASLGELEQGKPIIEILKKENPQLNIVISFYSPSGFEAATNYKLADFIFYLPLDTKLNAAKLLEILKPDLVLWIKYEYWWNILARLSEVKIPVLLISAIFQKRQPFFKWYGKWYRRMLHSFRHIFVQNHESYILIKDFITGETASVSGDTRFDRVAAIASDWLPVDEIEKWIGATQKVIIAGSTWNDDEKVLKHFIEENKDIKWIVAPHKTDEWSIKEVLSRFDNNMTFSALKEFSSIPSVIPNVLIIDCIGLLSRLYKYGDICFIGGGFSATGIHNALEAAVYGKPLIFGPEYEEYAEAVGLVQSGAAFSVENVIQLEAQFKLLLNDEEQCSVSGKAAKDFVYNNAGATPLILDFIYKNRLLTK